MVIMMMTSLPASCITFTSEVMHRKIFSILSSAKAEMKITRKKSPSSSETQGLPAGTMQYLWAKV